MLDIASANMAPLIARLADRELVERQLDGLAWTGPPQGRTITGEKKKL
jgi:hypothetical protein